MSLSVLVRGGGDLASGVVLRLARAGCSVVVAELAQPLAVRRSVSFAQAVYDGTCRVEEIQAKLISRPSDAQVLFKENAVAVIVDPGCDSLNWLTPQVLVDARMKKHITDAALIQGLFQVGLGPGFIAGKNVQAIVETKRGPDLGRVIWQGSAENDTGLPDVVRGYQDERVIRAPVSGKISSHVSIGDILKKGQVIAEINGIAIQAPFDSVTRGLIQDGLYVSKGLKIGDVDPRLDPELCWRVSDKALAVGGGVMEALLSQPDLRKKLAE